MTKEDWKEVEKKLFEWGLSSLNCDNYKITLSLNRKGMVLSIVVFINGKCDFNFGKDDCEERRKFFSQNKIYLYSATERRKMKRRTRKLLAEIGINPDSYTLYYSPVWKSFNSLKRHLINNCTSIEIYKDEN